MALRTMSLRSQTRAMGARPHQAIVTPVRRPVLLRATGEDDEASLVSKPTGSQSAPDAAPAPTPASVPALPPPPPPPAPIPAPTPAPTYPTPTYTSDFHSGSVLETSLEDIKAALLDSLYGTERGLSARSEVRAEINELISQLEAKNPTPNPTEVIEKLDGQWRLIYTSSSTLQAVMALGKLPLVTVGDLVQKIDSITMTVENKVQLSGPLSRTELTATSNFEVRSPKRLQLKLLKGTVATPELTTDLDIPSSVTVLGQYIDLTQLKEALNPIKDSAQGVVVQLNQFIGQVPSLDVPIQVDEAQTWQLDTYVDGDLRVARADRGAVFIYARV